jgi:hypothetical protein
VPLSGLLGRKSKAVTPANNHGPDLDGTISGTFRHRRSRPDRQCAGRGRRLWFRLNRAHGSNFTIFFSPAEESQKFCPES